jgi:predicted RNA methylase
MSAVAVMDGTMNTLHDERLATVLRTLVASGAKSVLDLGCGTGAAPCCAVWFAYLNSNR